MFEYAVYEFVEYGNYPGKFRQEHIGMVRAKNSKNAWIQARKKFSYTKAIDVLRA